MVILKGFIEVPEEEISLIINELEIHTKLTLEELGCITFSVVQDQDNPCKFIVHEEFESEQAFENHQQRVTNSNWSKVSVNVKRHYEIFKS